MDKHITDWQPKYYLRYPLSKVCTETFDNQQKTHHGYINIREKNIKWTSRYVIVCHGCLYIFQDKDAKSEKEAYSFLEFEKICRMKDTVNTLCLTFKEDKNPSITISCSSSDERTKWIEMTEELFSDVERYFRQPSDVEREISEVVLRKSSNTAKEKQSPSRDTLYDGIDEKVENSCTATSFQSKNKFRKANDNTMSMEDMDRMSMKDMDRICSAMASVGILTLPSGCGTLFRVGSKYGITAAHVLNLDPNIKLEEVSASLFSSSYVEFVKGKKFYLNEVVYANKVLDIAVLKFHDVDISDLPKPFFLDDISEDTKEVAVIGAHPSRSNKVLDYDVKVIKQSDLPVERMKQYLVQNYEYYKSMCIKKGVSICSLDNSYKGIEDPKYIILNAFLAHGASGAPVCTKTNPIKVVGVYICGLPLLVYELPELLATDTPEYPREYTFECATRMSFIYEEIRKYDKALAREIFRG